MKTQKTITARIRTTVWKCVDCGAKHLARHFKNQPVECPFPSCRRQKRKTADGRQLLCGGRLELFDTIEAGQ